MTTVEAKGGRHPNACERRDVARKLIHWDGLKDGELAEIESHASRCPVCGPRLSVLKRSQRILDAANTMPLECPSAEDLYDFGRGPGHRSLPVERLTEMRAHVMGCSDCQAILRTLEARPPLPLDLSSAPDEVEVARPRRRRLFLLPLAAAAGVLAAAVLWQVADPGGAGDGPITARAPAPGYVYPASRTLRGLDGPLYYPRGQVLAGRNGGLLYGLEFEIQPQEGASEYSVRLYRQSDDVFDRGEQISVFRGAAPTVTPPSTLFDQLTPGGYTWEAWCVVDGLDKLLDRRDFDVIRDPELLDRLEDLERLEEPQKGNSILTLLNGNHFYTDLRAHARTLPPSVERDRFLALPSE